VDSRESKSIIDRTGAEKLLGYGDMLYSATDSSLPIHAQAAYVSYEEVDSIIEYFKE
jgi:S-DNA-T family DNA segregation ATPase FtsK/SpoIIIE